MLGLHSTHGAQLCSRSAAIGSSLPVESSQAAGMRNCVPACLPWAAAHERLANSKSEATLEEAGWQRLRGLRAAILKEQKSASASVFH